MLFLHVGDAVATLGIPTTPQLLSFRRTGTPLNHPEIPILSPPRFPSRARRRGRIRPQVLPVRMPVQM